MQIRVSVPTGRERTFSLLISLGYTAIIAGSWLWLWIFYGKKKEKKKKKGGEDKVLE